VKNLLKKNSISKEVNQIDTVNMSRNLLFYNIFHLINSETLEFDANLESDSIWFGNFDKSETNCN